MMMGVASRAMHKQLAATVLGSSSSFIRLISEEQLGASEDQLQEMFQRNMAKASRRKPEDERPTILTTRREALRLYREILRYSNLFVWKVVSMVWLV
jgi:hypothetical protein